MSLGAPADDLKRPMWPRPGASMAVFRGEQVLLALRSQPPRPGLWALPGGHVEPGERAVDAAIREVREETGVEVRLAGLVTVHDAFGEDRAGRLVAHYVLAVFAGRWLQGEPRAASDAADARFFAPDELDGLPLMPHSRRIIEEARKIAGLPPANGTLRLEP